ncbi:matrixin family metalloprotease [Nitrososphaeria virus YSH_462411]|uniref:Matrixin family metalloprotease n=1 Tax=Nitrososphaeria virus YSH_462411 TaxID=3071321 RepID=A0A976UAH1_9CAUD|nr:matrixin family metalloprotease [Yangshan Harbor Nitrososphaeria virus]UVF62299.1 matrixin family metalloprotease [Nitrososphaeria virus YSH_462411]
MLRCQASINKNYLMFNNSELIENEWPHKWEHSPVTYRLNNLTNDIEKREHQIRAVTAAFRAWQLHINLKFKRVYDSFEKVDINISFQPLDKFDNRKGVLAHAYYPGQGELSGDIEINDEWNWVTHTELMNLSSPPLIPVLIHEIGHSLGLKHDTSTALAMMYPSFDLGKPKNKLHTNDITRMQSRYGKRTMKQRFIDYFYKRNAEGYDFR